MSPSYRMIANIRENVAGLETMLTEQGLAGEHDFILHDRQRRHGRRERLQRRACAEEIDLYEGGHRVPCFIAGRRRLGEPRDIGELTEAQDVLPTLIDCAA